ncbi:hypothetical protein [Ahrensia sp. R2A130]|uniref:hypothetical protein n=1 Tax=Ahrensia sp. R2A130 TaxID=744979 RepID=UPI0001E0A469|nr:hypothetical protein [Ahrensia sp. R2A130]EFL89651.1 putative lipoprotein [Ahrensia sp. R2A130]
MQMAPRLLLGIALALFLACLFMDGFYTATANPRDWSPGWGALTAGWMSGALAWWANPVLLASWLGFPFSKIVSAILALGSLALALSFFGTESVMVNSAGTVAAVTGIGPGYWVWLASMVVTILAALAGLASRGGKTTMKT